MCMKYLVAYCCGHFRYLDALPSDHCSINPCTKTITTTLRCEQVCHSCAETFLLHETRRTKLVNIVRAAGRPVKPMPPVHMMEFYHNNLSHHQGILYIIWRFHRMFIRALGEPAPPDAGFWRTCWGWKGLGDAWKAIGGAGGVEDTAVDRSIWNFVNIHLHAEFDPEWPCALIGHPRDSAWPVEERGWGFEDGREEQEVVSWVFGQSAEQSKWEKASEAFWEAT